jgi:hypothetical protein
MPIRAVVPGIFVAVLMGGVPLRAVPAPAPAPLACPARPRAGATGAAHVVRLRVYNQSRMGEPGVAHVVDVAGRVWEPYGVSIERGDGGDAVSVVLTERSELAKPPNGYATVLGTTLFTEGHATPYIRLSLTAAESSAGEADEDGVPFAVMPRERQEGILQQILGVALAHELAHYLLDTMDHSHDGLLRSGLSPIELLHLEGAHLRLTPAQQHRLCAGGGAGAP